MCPRCRLDTDMCGLLGRDPLRACSILKTDVNCGMESRLNMVDLRKFRGPVNVKATPNRAVRVGKTQSA